MQNLKNKLKEEGHVKPGEEPRVSNEEGYFYDWLLELKELGYINKIILQPAYRITDPIDMDFKRMEMKGRGKNKKLTEVKKNYSVMKAMKYTPDFDVVWNEKARGIFVFLPGDVLPDSFTKTRQTMFMGYRLADKPNVFFNGMGDHVGQIVTCIEVKGSFTSKNNSTDVKFPLLMKMIYYMYGIYVNKCMPLHKTKGTFAHTFTPYSYWFTEKTKKERKLAWTRMSIKDYTNIVDPIPTVTLDVTTEGQLGLFGNSNQ